MSNLLVDNFLPFFWGPFLCMGVTYEICIIRNRENVRNWEFKTAVTLMLWGCLLSVLTLRPHVSMWWCLELSEGGGTNTQVT